LEECYEEELHNIFMHCANNLAFSRGLQMSAIDEILWLLKDGGWHELKEIKEKVALSKIKTEIAVSFLTEYNFILLSGKTKKFRLQSSTLKFIEEIQRLEKENALSH